MLIPAYPNANIANQVCPVAGSIAGQLDVSGASYILASFDYAYSNVWRNLGILIAFYIFFIIVTMIAVERMPPTSTGAEVLLFKKGTKMNFEAPAATVAQSTMKSERALPVGEPDVFSWQHVNYTITVKGGKERQLLNSVQGYVKPGTMTCLMGESGAGKTTLLNVLAQRVSTGIITGGMFVNGRPLNSSFQRQTGYVQQQDVHVAEMTVREALRFSGMLRRPKTISKAEKYAYVEEVISLLDMTRYSDAVIGTPGEGLNVEQRKRVTIGVELAAKPDLLLFLDEPTSGLDSQSSWSIIQLLRQLTDSGQAILCTIHQPSAVLFQQFDRLLLLRKGGETVYFGAIGENCRTLTQYFEKNGAAICGDANPAEYILDSIGAGATAHAHQNWHEIWTASPEYANVTQEIAKLNETLRLARSERKVEHGEFAMPLSTQVLEVGRRMFIQYWRSPVYISSKFLLNVVSALFIGFTFFKTGLGLQALQNKLFAVYMSTIVSASLINQLQPRFIGMRDVFEIREQASKIYSWKAFAFSAIIVEMPYNVVFGTIFYVIWYYLLGFTHGFPPGEAVNRGGYGWLLYTVYCLWFSTFGQMIASPMPNPSTAAIIQSLLFSFVLAFNGVLQPPSQMPYFWSSWMYHLSPFTYLIEGLLSNVIGGGVPVVCLPTELNIFQPPEGQTCEQYAGPFVKVAAGAIYNPEATSNCEYCTYATGDQYLATRDMSYSTRWRNYGIMW